MFKNLVRRRMVTLLFLYAVLIVYLAATNPDNLPLPLLLVPFVLLALSLYLTVEAVLRYYFGNLGKGAQKLLALALTALPILLLLLQSMGQLSVRDLLITTGLVFGLGFYFRKTDFLK